MQPFYTRIDISKALDDLILREDGITFQRLARRLLREQFIMCFPFCEHNDLGQDALIIFGEQFIPILASLNVSISKIREDIKKNIKNLKNIKKIIFITPKTITNQNIQKLKNKILEEFNIELRIFERNWVIDECLRPNNSFVVYDELRLPIPHHDQIDSLLIGPINFETPPHQSIYNFNTISFPEGAILTWHTLPTKNQKEKIILKKIDRITSKTILVGNGADLECIPYDDYFLAAWVTKRKNIWDIWISKYDVSLNIIDKKQILKGVKLKTNVKLAKLSNSPCLVFSYECENYKQKLIAYFLNNNKKIEINIQKSDVSDFLVQNSYDQIIAVFDRNFYVDIYNLTNNRWNYLDSITKNKLKNKMITRMDFAINHQKLIFVLELIDYGICTIIFDLSLKKTNDLWQICPGGKFPSIVIDENHRIISWIGWPVLPIEFQGQNRKEGDFKSYIDVLENIMAEHNKMLKAELGPEKFYRHKLTTVEYKEVWSPVWLGVIDDNGKCLKPYGPLGFGNNCNFTTILSLKNNYGLLCWRMGSSWEYHNDCEILSRKFFFKDTK